MEAQMLDDRSKRPSECTDPTIGVNLTAYEFGWLSEAEARRFEAHVQTCRACLQDLRRMAPVWSILQDNADVIEQARELTRPAPTTWRAWFERSWRQLSVVASMALMVGMLYFFQPPAQDSELLSHETVHLRQPTGNAPLTQGLQALRAGDYRLAQTFFQKALAQSPESYEANYLLGLITLKEAEREPHTDLSKLKTTVACLQKAIAISEKWDNPVYAAQCYYYQARAYAAQKDPAQALDRLAWIERLPAGDPDLESLRHRAADLKALCRP